MGYKVNNFLKHISFTKNETGVILFAVLVLAAGLSVKYYKQVISGDSTVPYDFSKSDSEFKKSISGYKNNSGAVTDSSNLSDEKLISKIQSAEDTLNSKSGFSSTSGEIPYKSININTATKEEFISLPGVGESIAEKIIAYREERKRFNKIEDMLNVNGIGKKKFEKIKEYIKIE